MPSSPYFSSSTSGVPETTVAEQNQASGFAAPRKWPIPEWPESNRTCSLCKKSNDFPRYKLCSICREKGRKASERAKKRREERWKQMLDDSEQQNRPASTSKALTGIIPLGRNFDLDDGQKSRASFGQQKPRASLSKAITGLIPLQKSDFYPEDRQKSRAKRKSDVAELAQGSDGPVARNSNVSPPHKKKKLSEIEDANVKGGKGGRMSDMDILKKIRKEKENKSSGSTIVSRNTDTRNSDNTYICKRGHTYTEFQTGSDMYKYLQRCNAATTFPSPSASVSISAPLPQKKRRLLNFRGCHSIVSKLDIDEKKRARLVAEEVRKIAKLSFYHRIPAYDNGSKITYRCTCLAGTASSAPMTSSATLSAPPGTAPNEVCGGQVVITVEKDMSHPAGIPGQRIMVEVKHPA